MALPKLTVVVPTLKRPDTLLWTLKTALEQDYENYSILVSDNFSNDNTREIVDSFRSEKITYINPGQKLSMSHHWEFILKHIEDGYVTILGDDDGLLPGGLNRVGKILAKHPVSAIGWRFGNFNWKGLPPYFMIPMADNYRIVESEKEVKKLFQESIYQTIQFPSLYGGFISMNLIKQLRTQFGGQFFHSRIPDFFSGALVAASVDQYIRAEFPITINATSKHSTGFATINEKNDQSSFKDLQKSDGNIPFHDRLIFIRSNAIPIAEAMLQVHELIPSFPQVDIKRLLVEVCNEAAVTESESKFRELTNGIAEIARINDISTFGKDLVASVRHKPQQSSVKNKFSPVSLSLYIDTTNTGIDNVYDACQFAGKVIPGKIRKDSGKVLARIKATLRYVQVRSKLGKPKTL